MGQSGHICEQLCLFVSRCARYNFSKFAITLNELLDGLEEKVAPTDCRLRPDQRCLEIGLYDQVGDSRMKWPVQCIKFVCVLNQCCVG